MFLGRKLKRSLLQSERYCQKLRSPKIKGPSMALLEQNPNYLCLQCLHPMLAEYPVSVPRLHGTQTCIVTPTYLITLERLWFIDKIHLPYTEQQIMGWCLTINQILWHQLPPRCLPQ